MADLLQTISSNYVAMGSLYATAGKKYENVDPTLFEGTWRGSMPPQDVRGPGLELNGFRATANMKAAAR